MNQTIAREGANLTETSKIESRAFTYDEHQTSRSMEPSGTNARHSIQNMPVQKRMAKGNSSGLPDWLKSGIENLSGMSMDNVKVHYNSSKPAQLQAHAYAQGNEIHVGRGQEKHLPHEAWHVVQQRQGRVRPTLMSNGAAVNDDSFLEREADVMGAKAGNIQRKSRTPQFSNLASTGTKVVQLGRKNRKEKEDRKKRLLGRLSRAAERQEARAEFRKRGHRESKIDFADRKKGGEGGDNRLVYKTPFGTTRFGRGVWNTQPYGKLDVSEWPDRSELPATNYDAICKSFPTGKKGKKVLREIETYMSDDKPVEETQLGLNVTESASATLLSSLLPVAESHHKRNPVGGKPERAAIRYAQRYGVRKTFNRKNGAYVPARAIAGGAKKGGTHAWREMREGNAPIPMQTLDMLECMSESSDDEDVGMSTRAQPDRKVKKRRKLRGRQKNRGSVKALPTAEDHRSKHMAKTVERQKIDRAERLQKRRAAALLRK